MGAAADRIRQIVEGTDSAAGRAFDLAIQLLIVASIVSFSVETIPELSPATRAFLMYSELGMVVIFSIEYVVRFALARQKVAFVFSFFGMVDLAAILPFYLATGLDLRSLRALRLLRMFRVLKLVRYSTAMNRIRDALRATKEELIIFVTAALIVVYLSAVAIYYFEHAVQPQHLARSSTVCGGPWQR